MTTSVESVESSRLDGLKWAVALVLVGVGIGGFYFFAGHSLLLRVLGLLALSGLAIAIWLRTAQGRSTWDFFKESRVEVRKVVWPTRKETVQTTSIVMAMVTAVAIFLWLLDMVLAWAVKALIGQGG
jgi:preprotein translocase subunit SecE